MEKRQKDTEEVQPTPEEEESKERTVRHTISAEETFTLAKDVYDMRSFFKSLYSR